MTDLAIAPWREIDREKVIELILAIQTGEFGFEITRDDQPDLDQVSDFYRSRGGFWCAWLGNRMAGTIALKDIGGGNGALRKMFVAADYRGRDYSVARKLLEHLVAHARTEGLACLWLGTTSAFVAAHRFYEKNGFVRIDADSLPETFPRMALDTIFYKRVL